MALKHKPAVLGIVGVVLCSAILLVSANPVGSSLSDSHYGLPAAVAALEVHSVRHSRVEEAAEVTNTLTLDGYELLLEDDKTAVYFRKDNASLRLMDKAGGYIYGGIPDNEGMNKSWASMGNGIVAIDCIDAKLVVKKQGLGYPSETKFTCKVNGNRADFTATFTKYGISFPFSVALEAGDLTFSADMSQLKETGKYYLQNLYFAPFLGCTKEAQIPGYFFVPDGSGALIRFQNSSAYTVSYDRRIFGKDYAVDQTAATNDLKSSRPNDFLTGEYNITVPVFGAVHGVGAHGFVASVDSGAEFAAIMATPAGMTTPYNWITTRFIVRQNYMQPTSKSGSGVQVTQKQSNNFVASVRYHLLDGKDADYIGMAKWYREKLIRDGVLTDKVSDSRDIPLQLDIVMADMQKGFFTNHTTSVTTADQVSALMDYLTDKQIGNTQFVIKGWQKGGLNGYDPQKIKFESKSGSYADYKDLIEKAQGRGNRVVFFEDAMDLTSRQIGYSGNTAHSMSQMPIQLTLENDTLLYNKRLFLGLDILAKRMSESLRFYGKHDLGSVAFGAVGNTLYADRYRGEEIYRDQAKEQIVEAVKSFADAGETLAFYTPNVYLLGYASSYYRMPLTNSQFQFETDSVPFLPAVLVGHIDCFAPYVNEGGYSQIDMLKMIEYGVYPAYILTGKHNYDLADTASNQLYSTCIEEWENHIAITYDKINAALAGVRGHCMDTREVLAEGVVRVAYDNGTSVYVNYLGTDYEADGVRIPAQDYVVRSDVK